MRKRVLRIGVHTSATKHGFTLPTLCHGFALMGRDSVLEHCSSCVDVLSAVSLGWHEVAFMTAPKDKLSQADELQFRLTGSGVGNILWALSTPAGTVENHPMESSVSKFVDRLNSLGRSTGTPLGFQRANQRSAEPPMLLVAGLSGLAPEESELLVAENVQAGLILNSELDAGRISELIGAASGVPVGISLEAEQVGKVHDLAEAGCDFVVLDRLAPADTLEAGGVGRLLAIDESLDYTLARGINTLDVDAVLLNRIASSPLTIHDLLLCHRLGSLLSKPIVARLEGSVSRADVVGLWKAGVDALVVGPGQEESVYSDVAHAVGELPRSGRRTRGRWEAILPRNTVGRGEQDEEGDEEEEEESEEKI